jgi:hypothetical protein
MPPITRAEVEELSRLYGEWAEATSEALGALRAFGMGSDEFPRG